MPLPGASELAAVFACGGGALVSHRSAAALWGLLPGNAHAVDVTVVGRHCRSRPGIDVHQAGQIDKRDIRRRNGIPVTAPARTLIDWAATASDDEFEQAVSEARVQRLVRDGEIEAALARAGNRSGVARTRAVLRAEDDSGYTRSRAERLIRALLKAARLPAPRVNVPVAGYSVDFLWPEHKLIVEVDGFQFHGHRAAFERDRRKDQVLTMAGYRVIRITWRQLRDEPLAVAAAIAGALTACRFPG